MGFGSVGLRIHFLLEGSRLEDLENLGARHMSFAWLRGLSK